MGMPNPRKVFDGQDLPPQFDSSDYHKYGYLYDADNDEGFRLLSDTPSEQGPGLYHRADPSAFAPLRSEFGRDGGGPPRIPAREMRSVLEHMRGGGQETPARDFNPMELSTADLIERLNAYRQDARDANRQRDIY
jgi:hypothetical protein